MSVKQYERRVVKMYVIIVGVIWAAWLWAGWPHRHWWWAWGTLIAVLAVVFLSLAHLGQDRMADDAACRELEKKLETHVKCPTCGGEGWIERT